MRTKRAVLNSISSLILQLVTVIFGFILPRLVLSAFGSEVNGAVSSITQFLGYISLLEAGVGGVTRAALYKPLANADRKKISGVVNATQEFFKKLSYVFVVYTLVLSISFKYIAGTELSIVYTGSLVLIIAASTFAQYYFGITNVLILQADQRTYISTGIQIITIILHTIVSVLLIKLGCSIHIVKFASTGIFVLRPFVLSVVVGKIYHLDRYEPADNDAIKQRWSGLGQHIAFFLHNSADMMVITIFLGLKWVSVYNVYYMIVDGIRNIVNSLTGGSEAAFGNMIAQGDEDILNSRFCMIETLASCVIVIFFTTTGVLLSDFVEIYTRGIQDINYHLPTFGTLLVISEALHCVKQQYHSLVLAAGHYKETQIGAFVEAGLNIFLSVVLVNSIGISGVIIATIISTTYRMIDYVLHLKKCILHRKIGVFVKRFLITILNAASVVLTCNVFPFVKAETYFQWVLKAIPVFVFSIVITGLWNLAFYKENLKAVLVRLKIIR